MLEYKLKRKQIMDEITLHDTAQRYISFSKFSSFLYFILFPGCPYFLVQIDGSPGYRSSSLSPTGTTKSFHQKHFRPDNFLIE